MTYSWWHEDKDYKGQAALGKRHLSDLLQKSDGLSIDWWVVIQLGLQDVPESLVHCIFNRLP